MAPPNDVFMLDESKRKKSGACFDGALKRLDQLDEAEVKGVVKANESDDPTAGCSCDCDPHDPITAKASFHFGKKLSG